MSCDSVKNGVRYKNVNKRNNIKNNEHILESHKHKTQISSKENTYKINNSPPEWIADVKNIPDSDFESFTENKISLEALLKMGMLTKQQTKIIEMYLCQESDLFVCASWKPMKTDTLFKDIKRIYDMAVERKHISALESLIRKQEESLKANRETHLKLKNKIVILEALKSNFHMAILLLRHQDASNNPFF